MNIRLNSKNNSKGRMRKGVVGMWRIAGGSICAHRRTYEIYMWPRQGQFKTIIRIEP